MGCVKVHLQKGGGMNTVILMGRLTKDPEIRSTAGENPTTIALYSLAVDRRFKKEGQPEADFFDCTAFGRQAEIAEKYFKKGTKLVIQGRLQNDNYTDRDGRKVYRIKIIVESQEFAESKTASQQSTPEEKPAQRQPDEWVSVPDGIQEELPFV